VQNKGEKNMKPINYFTGYKLYEGTVINEKVESNVYVLANNLGEAAALFDNKYAGDSYRVIGIKIATDEIVCVTVENVLYYKIFHAHLESEWTGRDIYIVAENLSEAAVIAEEWGGVGYRVEKLGELRERTILMSEMKPKEEE
jgi:hypothetical protein